MPPPEFQFPVLGLTPDGDLWGFPDLRGLTTCGPRTLRDNMQEGMELVDCSGRRWVVRSVRKVGPAPLGFAGFFRRLLGGLPQYRIEQTLEVMPSLALGDVQARVCAGMEAHPEFWCEEDERETVLKDRLKEVRATKAISQIHGVLGLDTFQAY